jgi:chromosome partitioning protein
MRTLAICNQKGGVGKTTIALLLADAASRAGQRVLLVDLDPQANATAASGVEFDDGATLADVLVDPRSRAIGDAIRRNPWGLDVAVSSVELASKERNRRMADEHDLERLLATVSGEYDLVLVDSPPSLGVLTVNALAAADEYLVVADPTRFALDGVRGVVETAAVVRDYFNPDLRLARIVVNLFDTTLESGRRLAELRTLFPDGVLEPAIPRRVIVKEALARGRSLWACGAERGADDVCCAIERLLDQVVASRVG